MSNEDTYLQLDKQHNLKHLQDTRSNAAQNAVAKSLDPLLESYYDSGWSGFVNLCSNVCKLLRYPSQ